MKTPDSGSASNGSSGGPGPSRVYEQGRRVGSEARALASDLGELGGEVEGFLRRQLDARPYATLGAALGAGYVLGGGIPPWLFRVGFAMGGRLLLGAVMREVLAGAAGEDLEPPTGGPTV